MLAGACTKELRDHAHIYAHGDDAEGVVLLAGKSAPSLFLVGFDGYVDEAEVGHFSQVLGNAVFPAWLIYARLTISHGASS